MSNDAWYRVLAAAQVAGGSLASFTTAASMLPAQAKYTLAPDDWWIGKRFRINAAGQVGNVVTSQPTFTVSVNFGSTSVFSGGAMLTSTTAHTTVPWMCQIDLTVRSIGSGTAATVMGQGWFTSRAVLDSGATADLITGGHPTLLIPETTPAVGTGFDSTIANQVDFLVACSASSASNTWQLHQYELLVAD
jgi:hypothetical protein